MPPRVKWRHKNRPRSHVWKRANLHSDGNVGPFNPKGSTSLEGLNTSLKTPPGLRHRRVWWAANRNSKQFHQIAPQTIKRVAPSVRDYICTFLNIRLRTVFAHPIRPWVARSNCLLCFVTALARDHLPRVIQVYPHSGIWLWVDVETIPNSKFWLIFRMQCPGDFLPHQPSPGH